MVTTSCAVSVCLSENRASPVCSCNGRIIRDVPWKGSPVAGEVIVNVLSSTSSRLAVLTACGEHSLIVDNTTRQKNCYLLCTVSRGEQTKQPNHGVGVTAQQEQSRRNARQKMQSPNEGCTNKPGKVRGVWNVIVTRVSGLHAPEGKPPMRWPTSPNCCGSYILTTPPSLPILSSPNLGG